MSTPAPVAADSAGTVAHGSLEHWAAHRPDDVAIVDGERSLTYEMWNEAANRVANALAARGVEAGDIVVARTHIRLEWPIIGAALGKLGCKVLGLNWRLTPAEVQYVLTNSGARALICDDADPADLAPALDGLSLKLLVSIETRASGFVHYAELVRGDATPRYARGDPPLIVYTSGTTGLPKGVVMGTGSKYFTPLELAEYLSDVRRSRRSEGDAAVVLVTMPMHHGSGPAQVWGAMRGGRKMILMRRFDAEHALAAIERHRVTDWAAVPTMVKRIAGLPSEVLARYDVGSIRHLSIGAAPVPYALKEWVLDYFGEHCLSEGYGSTETGMVTRLPPDMQRAKPGSSGVPYKHVSVEIRDGKGVRLPAGSTGDIWIRTPTTLARYLHAAELGPEVLDENGFFRVGDVGHLDADGYLYITDRAKDLIISGGVNIYPAEVEAALAKHPAVLDVAVIGTPDDEYGEQVRAYCELKPGRDVTAADLAAFAAATLASYKRPRSIEFVRELPRNTMGKILKRELREPHWQGRERKV